MTQQSVLHCLRECEASKVIWKLLDLKCLVLWKENSFYEWFRNNIKRREFIFTSTIWWI
ncbi:hypothetical protein AHAS_Ahas09G0112400 [Arachis hypogaea]